MRPIPDIVPISELRQDAAAIFKRLETTSEPVFVTQHGKASAVILSAGDYERMQRELSILKSLARGEAEIARGEGVDWQDVVQEARAIMQRGD